MPKITLVEPQRIPRRFNIFLDGQFAFGADEDLVVNRRLVPGKLLDTSDVKQLVFEAEVGKLMERMFRLFNIRARSEKEIRDYLRNLSFRRKIKGQEEISEVATQLLIDQLKSKRLLNDEQFARDWVEARSKKYGKNKIRQELFHKGIDREIIDRVVSGQVTGDSEEQTAEKTLEKKLNLWRHLKPMEFRKKAYDYLLRRGFEYEIVKSLVDASINLSVNPEQKSQG